LAAIVIHWFIDKPLHGTGVPCERTIYTGC